MIHGEDAVEGVYTTTAPEAVSREGTKGDDARGESLLDSGTDNRLLLVPHKPLISCVGIEAKYGKARLRDTEVSL